MVNRPPPKSGVNGKKDDNDAVVHSYSRRATSLRGAPRRGLEWSLRSMHAIDTSAQHFLSNYYDTAEESSDSDHLPLHAATTSGAAAIAVDEEDQTAYEIFKKEDEKEPSSRRNNVWASLHAPLRTGIVDGKKVVFELRMDVTQRPTTSRKERLERKHVIAQSDRSGFEVRGRLWLMHFSLTTLTVVFFAVFIAMNAAFAGFFYATEDRCCDDPTMTFGEVFAFTVQTSTTIGYGSFSPTGSVQNFLVVVLSFLSTLINTIFAGLLFTKFVTPVINIQFSDVMTMCNVNGVPCLSIRLGNADGHLNRLTDINVRLTYSYRIPYTDHNGEQKFFQQTDELKLLSNRQHGLLEPWTLRHVLDESSPLFGLHFEEHPANKIYVFTLSIDAVQDLTKSSVNVQTEYALEDILIGHTFQNQVSLDAEARVATSDYSKMSDTEPYPVWYPALTGAYDTSERPQVKTFKP